MSWSFVAVFRSTFSDSSAFAADLSVFASVLALVVAASDFLDLLDFAACADPLTIRANVSSNVMNRVRFMFISWGNCTISVPQQCK